MKTLRLTYEARLAEPTYYPTYDRPGSYEDVKALTEVVGHLIRSDNFARECLMAPALIKSLREGLHVDELECLRATLDLPMDRLGPLLGLSKATLHRRKAAGRLDTAESDRVVRFARLYGLCFEVMESQEVARKWLISPQYGLGGAIPLEYAETEVGAREVEDLLYRLEHSVYS
jgi:putative toxin-antitoxin system antitoxin component (TIGR02293 family)